MCKPIGKGGSTKIKPIKTTRREKNTDDHSIGISKEYILTIKEALEKDD